MKVYVKKLLRAGMMPARTWRLPGVGMAPTESLKIEEADGSCCGQKEHDLPCLWRHMAWKLRKSCLLWLLDAGQKEYGQENGVVSKKKLG